ncbi:MAG TPA: M13 family metallopeptidase [Candidatus Polarisedimenticolaceae bacterium]
MLRRAVVVALTCVLPALPARAVEKRPLTELPYTPSLETAFMDKAADPCEDFYQYACGNWIKINPIPPDQSSWSVYGKLYDDNQQYLWGLLEQAASPDPSRPAHVKQVGDYFAACLDEKGIESKGLAPVRADLDAIAALASKEGIAAVAGKIDPRLAGSGLLFGFGSTQDAKDPERVIAQAAAGGLGLPDRDYYTDQDDKSKEIRRRYLDHVARMLELAGDSDEAAARGAQTVMRLETALATASLTRVEQRDPYKVFNKMTVAKLRKLAPAFDWTAYLAAVGASAEGDLNVTEPRFFAELGRRLEAEPLEDWKTLMRWHVLNAKAAYLPAAFERADFEFHQATLRGVKEMAPRWKRCVALVDGQLGEALGRLFVEEAFPAQAKAAAATMVAEIRLAMEKRLQGLAWMGSATRTKALAKLRGMKDKVGYPDTFRDYSKIAVSRDDFLGNVERAAAFETRRQIGKIGRPVDRKEWGMTPPTVNAYYNPLMNDMNFPAGVLLPPLFDLKMDAAPNYGNTGGTIGHELIHGFDDEGRKFDADGSLRDWWTKKDAKAFEERIACIREQYAEYTILDDIKINSALTSGEDVADLGGTILAYEAWKHATQNQRLMPVDGLTPDQRFFVGFAQWVCGDRTPESARLRAKTDPHSPGRYRINGVVVNMPEFAEAFQCKAGDAMVREKVCKVW